jgi:hypothetical protein
MNREDFVNELKLREGIQKIIKTVAEKKIKLMKNELLIEEKLRTKIRKLIEESDTVNAPHSSTGINLLSGVLRQMIPIMEEDYKSLTSDLAQRKSFRTHILNAAENVLDILDATEKADQPRSINEMLREEGEDDVTFNIGDDAKPEDDERFIEIDAKEDPDADEIFDRGIDPAEDATGRNLAKKSFAKYEKTIKDAYLTLEDTNDRSLFREYLRTNLQLYFDRFEEELSTTLQEPSSDSYEQAREGQPSEDLGI